MTGNLFLRFGALCGLAAVSLTIYMQYQQDMKLSAVGNTTLMYGWISMMLAGLFYSSISTTSEYIETVGSRMSFSAGLHLIIAWAGLIAPIGGSAARALNLTYTGTIGGQTFTDFAWGEKVTFAGNVATGVAQLLFLLNVFRGTSR